MATSTDTNREPAGAPPFRRVAPGRWMRRELFSTWWNTLLTLVLIPLVVWVVYRFAYFLLVSGQWRIIEVNLANLMVGRFPRDELWRLWLGLAILATTVGLGSGLTAATSREAAIAAGRDTEDPWHGRIRRLGPPLTLLVVLTIFVRTPLPIVLMLGVVLLAVAANLAGQRVPPAVRRWVYLAVFLGVLAALQAISGFGGVPRRLWGGLLLTAYFTLGTLVIAYPVGVMVALGRRSSLPLVRIGSRVYIELFRGSPLIVLLFMGWLILPFFLPSGFPTPDLITRALVIFVLFTSAYVAEIVRGGLQSLPRGQIEAAQALGLSPWRQTRLVVLPQALRNVIPALVGQAISLFKDTTLVLIIGLLDLLAVAQNITSQSEFLARGLHTETLVFVSLIYWVASYWLSRTSQRLEARLGVGTR